MADWSGHERRVSDRPRHGPERRARQESPEDEGEDVPRRRFADERIDRLHQLGVVVNAVGVPLILVLLLALYLGWVRSPLRDVAERNSRTLTEMRERFDEYDATIKRLADILRMVDCGAIPDTALRDRCLNR